MNKSPVDIEKFLPYGEMLRGFAEQPFVSKTDISSLLKQRGIFINNNEKKDTIPWLMCILLSPDEFDSLRECQNTKEDNQKNNTQIISWSSELTLLDCFPDNFDINLLLDLEFSNFTLIGSPNFVPIDDEPDHLLLEFEIERRDFSKNWANTQSVFRGSLDIQKIDDGKFIKFFITHTSNETKYVATRVTKGLVKYFKERQYINQSADIESILFCQFSNDDRVKYFLSLTRDISSKILAFEDVVDIEFSPAPDLILPDEIKWMEEKIKDLRVNGKGLHEMFIMLNEKYHSYVHLYHIDAKYNFDLKGLKGKCIISIGFPEYSKTHDTKSELEVNIQNISLDNLAKNSNKNELSKAILREFDEIKLNNLKCFIK